MENLTDEKLYELCKMYGARALEWRRKFVGLLPEVERRKLYLRKGFSDIFEFAAKLAGVSKEQVQTVIRADEKFADKPVLREALVSGEISANKLVRLVTVATVENQEFLAEKVKLLSNRAVEVLVRDMKFLHVQENGKQDGLFERKDVDGSLRAQKLEKLKLSGEVVGKLVKLQNKGLDINVLILEFLEKREKEIEEKKMEISREVAEKVVGKRNANVAVTRYVPAEVRKVLREEHGTKCAVPNCKKMAEALHHTARFGLVKEHNPYFMAPLCREHHEIAHAIDGKVLERKK